MNNALYIQSGGPTSVINCSARGVIGQCREHSGEIGKIYAALHGIDGVIRNELYDCSMLNEQQLKDLALTPSMAFGSCRYMVREKTEDDYRSILCTLRAHQISMILLNGGNGSASAALKLMRHLKQMGFAGSVLLIPKTVDNDIAGIDHSPGFPSAARHVVTAVSELAHDMYTYDTDLIMAVEVMGRNTGYLAAAAMAACQTGWGPDLIYVPERTFSPEMFVRDVAGTLEKKGKCLAVLSEGVKTEDGKYLFEDTTVNKAADPSRNMGGITPYLSTLLRKHFTCKIRCIDLGLMQRCDAHNASPLDRKEAEKLGRYAVDAALRGLDGQMVTIRRLSDKPYTSRMECIPLEAVADVERTMDRRFLMKDRPFIRDGYLDYILPLIGRLPAYADLKIQRTGERG